MSRDNNAIIFMPAPKKAPTPPPESQYTHEQIQAMKDYVELTEKRRESEATISLLMKCIKGDLFEYAATNISHLYRMFPHGFASDDFDTNAKSLDVWVTAYKLAPTAARAEQLKSVGRKEDLERIFIKLQQWSIYAANLNADIVHLARQIQQFPAKLSTLQEIIEKHEKSHSMPTAHAF